jgi:hypothetical protein
LASLLNCFAPSSVVPPNNIRLSELFFIRLEDTPELIDYLKKQNDVILEIGEIDKNGNNYLTQNYRQDELVNKSIQKCIELNYDWIFHIDSDELLDGNFLFLHKLLGKYVIKHVNLFILFILSNVELDNELENVLVCLIIKMFL